MRAASTTITMCMPLMVYGQNQAHISNQQLRGPALISDVAVDKDNIESGEVDTIDVTYVTETVNLIVLTESGCPNCQYSVGGPLNAMITSPGFADIINVKQFSFGNHYFVTEKCGGTGAINQTASGYNLNYSADTRHCWANNCINTAVPMDDCFGPGSIVSQHGPKEIEYNMMQSCAQRVAGYDWQSYWPFLVCTEANYGSPFDSNTVETATKCAEEEESYYQDRLNQLLACYENSDGRELVTMAKNTFDHAGVPTILVNGNSPMLLDFWVDAVAAEVCFEYGGSSPPPACADLLEKRKKFMYETEKAIESIVHGESTVFGAAE